MAVPVTLLYGSLNALVNLALGANVSRLRMRFKQFVGDTPHPDLHRASRVHGNNAEWMPLLVLLLLVLELSSVPSLWLHVFGGAILLARLMHATGHLARIPILSRSSVVISWLVMLAMIGDGLYLHFVARG